MIRLACLALLVLGTAQASAEWKSAQWDVMGTRASLEYWQADDVPAEHIVDEVRHEFERLNTLLSPWVADSDLARINSNASSEAVTVSEETYHLLETARAYSVLTDGAFDITFAGVGSLYDYRQGLQPDEGTLEQTLPSVSYLNMELLPGYHVRLARPDMRIDLGGIAKGYAIDRAIYLLKQAGISNAWISLGGDSFVLGDRRGRLWQVGIRHPRSADEVALTLPVEDIAVSTSGDYERFFMAGTDRVHHIINPGTGRPAGELSSVTILASQGIQADALSTSVFVLGRERGLALVEQLDDVSAIVIDRQGRVYYSADLSSGD